MAKQIRTLQLFINRLRSEEDKAVRQEFVTRVIFTLSSAGVVIVSALVFGLVLADQSDPGTVALTLVIDFVVILGWILIAAGRWRISASLLPLVPLTVAGYMVYTAGPITTGVLQLVLAVLLAGMLSGNRTRWVIVILASLVYFVAGWASGGLDLDTASTSGPLLVVTLVVVALLERFFTDQLDQSQATVQAREVQLESIFRAAPVGIGMVVDRVIQEANPTLCEMTGYMREELVGNSSHMLYSTYEDFEYVGREKYRQISQHGKGTVETRWRCKDGTFRDILLSSVPLDPNNLAKGVTFSALDLTERKKAEAKLRESAARYQAVVENQTEFIVRWKPDGTRTFANEAYLRYFNLTQEEALSTGFLPLVAEEDRRAIEEKISRLVSGQSPYETEVHRVIKPDGSLGWQEWTDHAICNDQGEIIEIQSVGRDVTERIQAEEALRSKTEEQEALFSISSHLRTAQSADAMLPVVLEEMRRVLHSDANAVIMLEPDQEHFIYALGDGPLAINTGGKFRAEKSISGLVSRTGQPYLTEDLSSDPQKSSTVRGDEGLGPAIFVPVVSESEFLGVLLCARKKNGASQRYSSSEVRLLTAIGEMVGNAMRRARLYDQALKRMQHLQTLHSIDTAISANLDLGVILDVLLTQGMAQLDVDAASVLLLNPHTHLLEFAAGKGFRTREIRSTRLRMGEELSGKVALERRILHTTDLPNNEDFHRKFLLEEGFVSYQAAPLIAKGQLQGVLEIFNRREMVIDTERTEFLETLAIQAAIAIDNSQLFSDLQRTNFELEMAYDATIEGWSRALELRDMETEGHTLRVAGMTVQLAQELRVASDELVHIRRGALLHDIGKMGVPDRILLKPGKLDEQEWEVMKRHTVYAYEMLWPIEFLRPALDIPYCHHERWDGTGYPRQLKAEHIPLSARLFAVAEVWDALTSNRPYRKAWTERKALEYIKSNAGKHFDPQVVEVFFILRNKQRQELVLDYGK